MSRKSLFTLVFILMVGMGSRCLAGIGDADSWGYQLQNADPVVVTASKYDVIVMDYSRDGTDAGAYSPSEIQLIKDSGKTVLAYFSIGEAEDYRF